MAIVLMVIMYAALSFDHAPQKSMEDKKKPASIVERIDHFDEIAHIFNQKNDTVYLINFWATTCPPCLKELPMFDKIKEKYKDKKLRIYLVNIDDKERFESAVIPYVKKLHPSNKVFSLLDDDYTTWTAKINPEWYGALPYTVIYNKDKRKYFFGAFKNEEELEKELEQMFNR